MFVLVLLASWFLISLGLFYRISAMPVSQPMFSGAMKDFLSTVQKGTLLRGSKFSALTASKLVTASKLTPALMAPSISERVPLIDMRELSATLPFDNPDGGAWKQGWDVKPISPTSKDNPIKIFVVPHSHCDPGWIKTFDEYFQSQTKQILTTVVQALANDPRRKFIWAEISYFEWWWKEQTPQTQRLVRKLLAKKQLEFVTGGWVQPDEANTQLYAMEIQLQEGHDWIRQTLGDHYIPKYGWSIDPFGYSPTMAYLLKKYGFKAMLIQRVHYAIKKELAQRQHLEFKWRQVWDDSGEYDIFCHVMPFFSYDVPHTCGPDPSVCCQFDFARITKYGGCPWKKPPRPITEGNVRERSLLLLDQYLKKASLYRSNVVIAPLGDDFRYQNLEEAESQYTNYQKIFDYINANVDGVEIQFGTLSDYFEAAMNKFDPPLLKGSFFTYSDVNQDYWSGYYTSRVFDKSLDRVLEQTLFAASSLGASKLDLQDERRALSLFQHHDGVTGTAKDHVVRDYAKRIHTAIRSTQQWIGKKLVQMQSLDANEKSLVACLKSDDPRGMRKNECDVNKAVYVYNPLKESQSCGNVEVGGEQASVAKLPCDEAGPVPGVKSEVQFDPHTGRMTHPIREEWMTWVDRGGGAYLFVPEKAMPYRPAHNLKIEKGGYIITNDDNRGSWSRQVIERKVPSEFGTATIIDFVYETNLQTNNQEWFVRFTGDIKNQGVFHTDLNGFNFDTHYFRKDMPLQSQVFPMPTLASIEDGKTRMTILSDHAQGTASSQESSIDVWLDRRITTDDSRGLAQGVTDNVPTRTRLRLVLEPHNVGVKAEFRVTPLCRRMWDELNHPLEIFSVAGKSDAALTPIHEPAKREEVGKSDAAPAPIYEPAEREEAAAKPFLGRMWDMFHPQVTRIEVPSAVAVKPPDYIFDDTKAIPFVFMVYKRVDFFKKAIDSLLKSDFPRDRVPLIVSHDGHFEDFVVYVKSLKDLGFKVIQLFHPFACSEHPDTFPGEDPTLNQGYKGDFYGNPRTAWVTCCKHHFTWLMRTVYDLDLGPVRADHFLFMEEDYVVAPTVYSSILSGLHLMDAAPQKPAAGFFGLVLDTSDGFTKKYDNNAREAWLAKLFITGPMVMPRVMFDRLRENAAEYCHFDDYNW